MLSLPRNSPLHSIANRQTRLNVLLAFVIGFLFGYVAYIVGAVLALEGMRSLIHIFLYRSEWIHFLRVKVPTLFRKTNQGRIIQWKASHRNPLTGEDVIMDRYYQVQYEYTTSKARSADDPAQRRITRLVNSQDGQYSTRAVRSLVDYAQEVVGNGRPLQFLYLISHPDRGLPLHLVEQKRQDMLLWARYVSVGIACFGLTSYFLLAFMYAILAMKDEADFWKLMGQATLSPLLMTPYLILQAKAEHRQRIRAWTADPLMVLSEFENCMKYWDWLGSTKRQKLYAISSFFGASILLLCCGWETLSLALGAVYCIMKWVNASVPIESESLEAFYRHATTVSASVLSHWWSPSRSFYGSSRFYLRIYYLSPSGHHVVKDIQSKLLYEQLTKHNTGKLRSISIDILVDPEHPLSGYPKLQFLFDAHNSWSLSSWHKASFVALWLYLVAACFALDVDLDNPPEELVQSTIIILLGTLLLIPQASVLRRRQYNQYILDWYQGGNIVDSPPVIENNKDEEKGEEEKGEHLSSSDSSEDEDSDSEEDSDDYDDNGSDYSEEM